MTLLLALLAQGTDPVLDALFAAPPAPPSCSVTLKVDVRETKDGATERQVYAYDRTTDAWTYIAQDGEAPPEDEAEEAEDDAEVRTLPASYYAKALDLGGLAWTAVTGETGLYRLTDLPDEQVVMNGRDVSARVALDYRVEAADGGARLASETAYLKAPWRIPFIARIDGFAVTRDYAPAGEGTGVPGAMLPVRERITFKGDVTGKKRDSLITTAYGDWDCVPGAG